MQQHFIPYLLFCSLSFALSGVLSAQQRPNFIFILTDDQSYGMMGCTGNEIVRTPHLDQLAREGVLFSRAYVTSAICTPSRTSILTSQYERRHGINFNSGTSLAEAAWEQTYPMVLRRNGYYTGWIGKNHVPAGGGGYASGLMEKSFDYWYAGHGHLGFYPKERHDIFRSATADTQVEVVGEGVEDFLSNEKKLAGAVSFLEKRPEDQPFTLSVCFNLPHGSSTSTMQLRESDDEIYRTLYRDLELPLPPEYVAKENIETPKLPADLHHVADRQTGYDYVDEPTTLRERYVRQLQAMTGIDRMVGQLRAELKRLGLAENTVLIFTSDHGLFMGEYGLGGKAFCYEKTTHVPLIVYDPRAPANKRNKNEDALVQSIDVAPTLLAAAGIPVPESYQGKNLLPLLAGEITSVREYVFTENLWSNHFGNPRCEAIQNREWKYIRYYRNDNFSAKQKIAVAKEMGIPVNVMLYRVHDPEIAVYRSFVEGPLRGEAPVYEELFHLKTDPRERENLAADLRHAVVLEKLRQAWKRTIHAARGEGPPLVLRYTKDSEEERKQLIKPE